MLGRKLLLVGAAALAASARPGLAQVPIMAGCHEAFTPTATQGTQHYTVYADGYISGVWEDEKYSLGLEAYTGPTLAECAAAACTTDDCTGIAYGVPPDSGGYTCYKSTQAMRPIDMEHYGGWNIAVRSGEADFCDKLPTMGGCVTLNGREYTEIHNGGCKSMNGKGYDAGYTDAAQCEAAYCSGGDCSSIEFNNQDTEFDLGWCAGSELCSATHGIAHYEGWSLYVAGCPSDPVPAECVDGYTFYNNAGCIARNDPPGGGVYPSWEECAADLCSGSDCVSVEFQYTGASKGQCYASKTCHDGDRGGMEGFNNWNLYVKGGEACNPSAPAPDPSPQSQPVKCWDDGDCAQGEFCRMKKLRHRALLMGGVDLKAYGYCEAA